MKAEAEALQAKLRMEELKRREEYVLQKQKIQAMNREKEKKMREEFLQMKMLE